MEHKTLIAVVSGLIALWLYLVWPTLSSTQECDIHALARPFDVVRNEMKIASQAGIELPSSQEELENRLRSRMGDKPIEASEMVSEFCRQGVYLRNFTDLSHEKHLAFILFGFAYKDQLHVVMSSETNGWAMARYSTQIAKSEFGQSVIDKLKWSDVYYPPIEEKQNLRNSH